ncbi:MAG TPA: hypothetical protein VIO15_08955 [Bacteroidales bacterium]
MAFFLIVPDLSAQNLEKIGTKKPLKITGGISANQIGYITSDSNSYRDPYTWVFTGNLNFNLYDWNVPVSYTVSNYDNSFQQPFNQYSMHPTYKWLQLHGGYCSMTFSPYTLSGHTFLGGGVDLTPPGIFKFSAMAGRLQKAVAPDSNNLNIKPAFTRVGFGVKTGLIFENSNIDFSLFRASDNEASMRQLLIDSTIRPQENLVLSVAGKTTIIQKIILSAEIAGSALTVDKTLQPSSDANSNIYSSTGLFKMRQSSSIHNAYKTSIGYTFENSNIGLAYERIDPGYTTLGAYYSNNDFENYTINASTAIFNNKVSLSISSGIQYDNLDNKKSSRTNRYVNSLNVSYNASEKLNLSGAYSNFSTYTNIRSQFEVINQTTPFQNPDTLNYTQLSQSANANISYVLNNDQTKRQNISVNLNYMVANDKQASNSNKSDFVSSNLSYSHCLVPLNLTITGALNANYNKMMSVNSVTIGPSVSINKLFLNKALRTSITVSKNNSYSNGDIQNTCFITRFSGGYAIMKKHNLSLSLIFSSKRSNYQKNANSINDLTGTLSYNYNF